MTTGVDSDATYLTFQCQGSDVLKVRDGGVDIPAVGSRAFPALSFQSSTTGLYNESGACAVSVAGRKRARVTEDATYIEEGQLLAPQNASLSTPAFSFTNDTNSGLTSTTNGQCSVVAGGYEVLRCTSSECKVHTDARIQCTDAGTTSSAAVSFGTDANTGIYYPTDLSQSLIAGGSEVRCVYENVTSDVPLQIPDGTVSAPSLCFSSDTNTGLYTVGNDDLAVACGGANSARFRSTNAYFPLGMRIGSSSTTILHFRRGATTPTMTLAGSAFTGENHLISHTRIGRLIILQARLRWTAAPSAASGQWVVNNILPLGPETFPATPFVTNHQGASVTDNRVFFSATAGSLHLTAGRVSATGVYSTTFSTAEFGNASLQGVCFTFIYTTS